MNTYKTHLIKAGEITVDKSIFTRATDIGMRKRYPVWALAIEGNGKRMLADTGVAKEITSDWLPEGCYQISGVDMEAELNRIGWRASDVTMIIHSHLHRLNCGNDKLFQNAEIVVSKRELMHALNPVENQKNLYSKELLKQPTEYLLIEGERKLDSGLVIIATPGHTPGHQSVLINTQNGVLCFAGGAAALNENLEQNLTGSYLVNAEDAFDSMDQIRRKSDFVISAYECETINVPV